MMLFQQLTVLGDENDETCLLQRKQREVSLLPFACQEVIEGIRCKSTTKPKLQTGS